MKILVIGGGGREHALVWKISHSPRVKKIFCAPGNPGTADFAENVAIQAHDIYNILNFALENGIDLTVVGPELPLTLGIVDRFKEKGLCAFGPDKKAAVLEGSKVFAKNFMKKYNIPTAKYDFFTSPEKAIEYIESLDTKIVVKADGLAAGKGVIICQNKEEAIAAVLDILQKGQFGEAGNQVVVEEFLEGEEVSFMAFSDGVNIIPMVSARDHKQVFDGNTGPNTGGMGAYSPSPLANEKLSSEIMDTIITPAIRGMGQDGRPYKGVIYAGVMVCDGVPKALEFNCRFGDPETQPILMRLKSDIIDLFERSMSGTLDEIGAEWSDSAAACIVMASGGYPGAFEKGKVITGLNRPNKDDEIVFHGGTAMQDGEVVTAGGRVLGVTALGIDIEEAVKKAYSITDTIRWDGVHYRTDIGSAR